MNLKKMEESLSNLTSLVLKIQATGDKAAADELEAKYSKTSKEFEADKQNLIVAGVPTDIRFNFKR